MIAKKCNRSIKIILVVSLLITQAIFIGSCKQGKMPTGRWDVAIHEGKKSYPSWFEIQQTEDGLQGRFVGRVGSVRPITTLRYQNNLLFFALPVQWEKHTGDMEFSAQFDGQEFLGTTYDEKGNALRFEAVRAPELNCAAEPEWGQEISLLSEEWVVRNPDSTNGWRLEDGIFENIPPSTDIITRKSYSDFKLSTEVYLPEKSNSGIYLRGRYEIQLNNMPPAKTGNKGRMGAVYGFIEPDTLFETPGGYWYTMEITIIGRCVTVKLNDIQIIDHQEIPGITGGALDSREGEPGPIMLQGDHGPVKFRNMILIPAEKFSQI